MIIPVGITQAVADGRYVRLSPSSIQTGAMPLLELASAKSLLVEDSAGAAMFRLQDGGGTTANDAIVIGNSTPSPGNVLIVSPSTSGNITLGTAGQRVQTGHNTLDDGSGNELAAGALTVFSGTAFGTNQVFLKAGSGAATLIQTDAGGSVNHLASAGHYVGLGQVDNSNKGIYVGEGTINMDVKLGTYDAVAIAGYGLSPIYAAGLLISLGTTSTAVASYTPTSATGQSFTVKWRLSAAAATTPTLTLTWTDPKAGAQSVTLSSVAMAANTTAQGVLPVVATSAAAISVTGSALVAGDIFATVEVVEDQ